MLAKKYRPYLRQVACWKKTNFTLTETIIEAKKFYRLTETLAEKSVTFTFTRTFAKKRQADFENLWSQPRTKPKLRNKTNQSLCWPKLDLKTLKPISATRQNQPETMPTQKPPPMKNTRTWKPACWKKYWPILLTWKTPPLKNDYELLSQLSKRNLRIKDGFVFALRRCQPTVCVTCWWVGVDNAHYGGKCLSQKNA